MSTPDTFRMRPRYLALMRYLFHQVSYKEFRELDAEDLGVGFGGTDRFFARYPHLSMEGKTVLDYGCGFGTTCFWAARHGAERALGVDIQDPAGGREALRGEFADVADRVELRQIAGAEDLNGETFDLVVSKNSFEHIDDPASFLSEMVKGLAPDGQVVIGFSPLWKAFSGGHLIMTSFPWAHLIFPEAVVMAERQRMIPEETPARFSEVRGGLNQMTLAKFEQIMADSGLENTYFEINSPIDARGWKRRSALVAMDVLRHVPGLREYFTFSVHTMWRLPAPRPA